MSWTAFWRPALRTVGAAGSLVLALAACGGSKQAPEAASQPTPVSTTPSAAPRTLTPQTDENYCKELSKKEIIAAIAAFYNPKKFKREGTTVKVASCDFERSSDHEYNPDGRSATWHITVHKKNNPDAVLTTLDYDDHIDFSAILDDAENTADVGDPLGAPGPKIGVFNGYTVRRFNTNELGVFMTVKTPDETYVLSAKLGDVPTQDFVRTQSGEQAESKFLANDFGKVALTNFPPQ